LRTQPSRPSLSASSRVQSRKHTPCTRPVIPAVLRHDVALLSLSNLAHMAAKASVFLTLPMPDLGHFFISRKKFHFRS
jgi:hypothetical protein